MFTFGEASIRNMIGVHPELILVASRALKYSPVDFGVHDGVRTMEEQEENVRSGVSQTMNSLHLPQADELGWALDIVPYVNGKMKWEWMPLYDMARAMHQAATELNIPLRWGGVWDRPFLSLNPEHLEREIQAYSLRRKMKGKPVFLDGPHYQRMMG